MKKIFVLVVTLILFIACNSRAQEARVQAALAETFVSTSYNYTQYRLYSLSFKKASVPFRIDDAASAGSIFLRETTSEVSLDDGERVKFTSRNCCFIWADPIDKPMQVRVVWNVVFDSSYYDGQSSVSYNEATSRQPAPGTRWCEAIVDVVPSKSHERPDTIVFHFLKDGTVQAQLATFKTEAPLSAHDVRSHSANFPMGTYCKKEISNPYFGIPVAPHTE